MDKDIDQLTKILQLVGKPDAEFLQKITSETVSGNQLLWWFFFPLVLQDNG